MVLPKLKLTIPKRVLNFGLFTALILSLASTAFLAQNFQQNQSVKKDLEQKLASTSAQLTELKNQDQIKRNDALEEELKNINKTYNDAVSSYEKLTDLKAQKQDTAKLDPLYAQIIKYLAKPLIS